MSRWSYNPCSTHATCKNAKISVCKKAADIFQLTPDECEKLANKAGLSLCSRPNALIEIYQNNNYRHPKLSKNTVVSERMLQYYMTGKEPTKQALLAIAITLGLELSQIDTLLHAYGYCMSKSLPNDAAVLWHLQNKDCTQYNTLFLYTINECLAELELPLLMTKPVKR